MLTSKVNEQDSLKDLDLYAIFSVASLDVELDADFYETYYFQMFVPSESRLLEHSSEFLFMEWADALQSGEELPEWLREVASDLHFNLPWGSDITPQGVVTDEVITEAYNNFVDFAGYNNSFYSFKEEGEIYRSSQTLHKLQEQFVQGGYFFHSEYDEVLTLYNTPIKGCW